MLETMWTLRAHEIHVWISTGLPPGATENDDARLLSSDETDRTRRYRSPEHGARFAFHRATLRRLLGKYLGRHPGDVGLSYGQQGKPQVHSADGTPEIQFNLSHCDAVALFAFARDSAIGVDVERQRPLEDMAQLVDQCLTVRERQSLDGLTEEERLLAFWRCWTQKEALSKAIGLGLNMPLKSIEVRAHPLLPPAILSVSEPSDDGRPWSCHELSIAGHVAMLVARGPERQLTVRSLEPQLTR